MSEAYYRKWRPLDWESVIGQKHVIQTLKNAITQGRIAHAYLFSGPRGTGKTSTARILAKSVNCLAEDITNRPCNACDHCEAINSGKFLDLIEIDAASNTSVDDVRALREKINFSPTQGRYKVYIIDEVHMLSNAAFNALLKTLEEPPAHAIFVLATTEVHKIPPTVLSRCQRHEFRRIPLGAIKENLKEISERENISIEPSAITEIARQATGSMRDAVSLLDQLASTGTAISLVYTKEVLGSAANDTIVNAVEALIANNAGEAISIINHAIDGGSDPRQFGRQIVDFLRNLLLVKMGNAESVEVSDEESTRFLDLSKRYDLNSLISAIEIFDRSAESTSLGWQPSLQLELGIMKLCQNEGSRFLKLVEDKSKKEETKTSIGSALPTQNKIEEEKREQPKKSKSTQGNDTGIEKINSDEEKNPEKRDIQSDWQSIKDEAKTISAETAALLNSCKSVSIKNGKVVMLFSSSILQSKMENGNNMENARYAIKTITGLEYEIKCDVQGNQKKSSDENSAIDHDGMIGAALSLGGKMSKEK